MENSSVPRDTASGDVGGERGDRACGSDAWNRGDREAFLALWDEEGEFYPLRAQLEGESYSGHEGLMRFLAEMTQDFEEVRLEIEETRDAGEQVVGVGRFRARGRASGVDITVPLGVLTRVRRGKIVYTRFFSEPADALEAAGLSE
jgi:ketosteroid isomerase-like protein